MAERLSPTSSCPDLESWCAYVDGSAETDRTAVLTDHLRDCDRCFATVSQLRGDLAATEEPVRTTGESRPAVRRAVLAAAATLAIMWIGLWQTTRPVPDPTGFVAGGSDDGRFGFVRRPDPEVVGPPVPTLIVFTQFAADAPVPVPIWAHDLFGGRGEGSLASTCRQVSRGLTLDGHVLPDRYRARLPAAASSAAEAGLWRRYVSEILRQVDADVDLSRFDGDGDGVADFVFVVLGSAPDGFLPGGASGRAGLGVDYESGDAGVAGVPIAISGSPAHGSLVAEDAGSMAREMCTYLEQAMQP